MARRGVFGRLPRAAPDLTNTIVALVREANAMEDQNFVDAWKNGGKVSGKGVDDERLLAHMKHRRDQLDPSDPAWDQWNNRVAQYDFSINESKMSLKFDQKKISEAQMSAFYGKWAKRPEIQQDSEFYRHLLSQQAKWHTAAAQGRSAGGRSSKYEAHNKWVSGVIKDKLQGAVDASWYVLKIAKTVGAAPSNATSLDDVYENTTGWGIVQDAINDGVSDNPVIQGLINEATEVIRKSKGKDWKWGKTSLENLWDESDEGNKLLIKNAMSPTERKQWQKNRAETGYEQQRIKGVAASKRIADANVDWMADMDNCNGDAFCAREVTKTYRDVLAKNAKYVVGGQGGIKATMQDDAQAQMVVATMAQLDDIVAGRPVSGTPGTSGTTGPRTKAVVPLTQQDAIHGTTEPGNFIADTGNRFNQDIAKLSSGGWVESVPTVGQGGDQEVDGEGNPVFHFVTHPPTEQPPPGLVAIKGVLSYTDANTLIDRGPDQGKPVVVRPTQYVSTSPAAVITQDAGGTIIEGNAVGRPGGAAAKPGSVEQTTPSAGYTVLHGVVGPDGTPRVVYRTGNGSDIPYMFHTEPPVVGARTQTDPKTGVKTPILTATPVTTPPTKAGDQPTTTMVYDTTPLTDGFRDFRTQLPSGNFVLGTYRTMGATAAAQSINSIFAKDGTGPPNPKSLGEANKLLDKYKAGVAALPDNDPEKFQASFDMKQLDQWTQLHAGRKVGQTYDDDYGTVNDRNPQQMRYEDQLRAGGFNTLLDRDETGRRVTLLGEIDKAEARVNSRAAELAAATGRSPYGYLAVGSSQADLAALTAAKKDIYNPTISVSNIKIPGVDPMMQNASPEELARQAGIAAGLSTVGGAAPQFPAGVPYKAPVAPGVPSTKGGPPTVQGPNTIAPPAAAAGPTPKVPVPEPPKPNSHPKTPGLVAPPTPTAGALTPEQERRKREEERRGHGATEFG